MIRLNDKPAIRIKGYKIRSYKRDGKSSTLCNCEGDQIWFPDKYIKFEDGGTMLIEEWLYNAKVAKGEL